MRPVFVVTSGKRVPYHVRDLLDELPGGVFGVVYGKINGALDYRVELSIERLGDVILDGRQYRLIVNGVLLLAEGVIARQRVLDGADEDREQREIRLGAVLQLILEDLHDRGDAPDREEGPVPVMKARHVACRKRPAENENWEAGTARARAHDDGEREKIYDARVSSVIPMMYVILFYDDISPPGFLSSRNGRFRGRTSSVNARALPAPVHQ